METISESCLKTIVSCPDCTYKKKVSLGRHKDLEEVKCPDCGYRFRYRLNCIFEGENYTGISPKAFSHPLDKKSIEALRNIPLFETCVRKMIQYGYEKFLRVNAMADDVKVSPRTCSYIHDMATIAARRIDIEIPDVYLNHDPHPNAYTFGIEYPMVTVTSGLIELMDENELFCVIAHEITHIKCHHVLYHMLARFLSSVAGSLGLIGSGLVPINLALFEWSRKSELTADRGALLISNNRQACVKMLMKLAGGSEDIAEMIDAKDFVTQAEQFQQMTRGLSLNKFYRVASTLTRTHPFPVLRAYELNKWADSEEYHNICSGNYDRFKAENDKKQRMGERKCPHCGHLNPDKITYCQRCAQILDRLSVQYDPTISTKTFRKVRRGFHNTLERISSRNKKELPRIAKKICPECNTIYGEEASFCIADGSALISIGDYRHYHYSENHDE